MVMHLWGHTISKLEIQCMSFCWSINNFVFHSIDMSDFMPKKVLGGNFNALLYWKAICSWNTLLLRLMRTMLCWKQHAVIGLDAFYVEHKECSHTLKNIWIQTGGITSWQLMSGANWTCRIIWSWSHNSFKTFEYKLEALLHDNSCQVQTEPAESFGVDHTTVSKHLNTNWRHYFMTTHVRCKLNLQNHLELITQQFQNIWIQTGGITSWQLMSGANWNCRIIWSWSHNSFKTFEYKLEALLHDNSCQVQTEPAESFGVDHTTVSKHLKALGMIQKAWTLGAVQVEAERCLTASCHMWIAASTETKERSFCIVSWLAKWIHYNNPKHRRTWAKPGHASASGGISWA